MTECSIGRWGVCTHVQCILYRDQSVMEAVQLMQYSAIKISYLAYMIQREKEYTENIESLISTLVYQGVEVEWLCVLSPSLRVGDFMFNCNCHGWIIWLCVLRVRYNVLTIPLNMTGRGVHNVGSWSSREGDDSTRNLSVLCVHLDW